MTLKELQAKRQELAATIRKQADQFNSQDGQWKDDQKQQWEAVNTEYDEVIRGIEAATQAQAVAARVTQIDKQASQPSDDKNYRPTGSGDNLGGRPLGTPGPLDNRSPLEIEGLALQGAMRIASNRSVTEDQQIAMQLTPGIQSGGGEVRFPVCDLATTRALQQVIQDAHPSHHRRLFNAALSTATAGSGGGNTIPAETLRSGMEVNMLSFGGLRPFATIVTTDGGEPWRVPTMDDTGNSGRLLAENTAADDNAGGGTSGDGGPNPAFSKQEWNAYLFTSDTVLMSQSLLEDSVANLVATVSEALGERLGRVTAGYYATGTGTSQPQGIVTAAPQGVLAASGTAIAPDEVYELQHSVDPAYRVGAAFMCHDSIIFHLRTLKDSQNRYLWQSGMQAGIPDQLAGSPIYPNQSMVGTLAINNEVLIYGQLSKYIIRRVRQVRMYVLNERYREKDQVGVVAFVREDGGLNNAGTAPVKKLKLAAA